VTPVDLRPALRLVGALLLATAPGAAQEREEILSYDVAIDVRDGGFMDVTEEIAVRALGNDIRRGIYRDFPTSFPRATGMGRIEAPFEVREVLRDGKPEPYRVESIGGPLGRGGVRVRIGDADVMLEHGVHRYTIRYETSRWVSFGDTEDQLYWNVTGNGWDFPIRHASARLSLPEPPDPADVRLEAWTGPEGSTASAASTAWNEAAGVASFESDAPLGPREGLTVRLTFPKEVVAPPSAEVQKAWFRQDWGGWIDAATVAGLVLSVYLLMWSRVGRDPEPGPVVVRYGPPDGFSPAALGYLARRGWSDMLLASALVSAAVKGALRIERDGRKWTLERLDGTAAILAPEERKLSEDLLSGQRRLELHRKYHARLRKAVGALRRTLSRKLEREYFVLNRRWFAAGAAVSVVGLGVLAWRDRYGIPPDAWFLCLWLTFWTVGTGTLVTRAWRAWRSALGGGGIGSWAEAVFLSLFSLPFVGAEVFVGGILALRVPHHLLAAAAALGVLNILFYHLLERPTLRGRGVLNELDGFKTFLTATDADRLDRMNPPDRTPQVFERFLPYAIALGVENRWADRFRGVLVPQAPGGGAVASPAWYSGGSTSDLSAMASSLGNAFSSSLSAASSPPSSSGGGSGGGGSSGGGGGGGGGGGW
jgi:uncharacterized membrane protein YgcG